MLSGWILFAITVIYILTFLLTITKIKRTSEIVLSCLYLALACVTLLQMMVIGISMDDKGQSATNFSTTQELVILNTIPFVLTGLTNRFNAFIEWWKSEKKWWRD